MRQVHKLLCQRRNKTRNGEHGAVIIEYAIVLPLIAVLFLVIINLGLLAWEYQVLQNAAREGARFSALPYNQGATGNATISNTIKNRIVEYCAEEKIGVSPSNIAIDQTYHYEASPGSGIYNQGSLVTVSYTRTLMFPGASLLPSSQVTLTGSSVFRNMY
jgi:Flp pilus assembly protein TadG